MLLRNIKHNQGNIMTQYLSACLENPVSYQLNDNRIEKILTARTLDEATKMGLWDRILDYFRGGEKQDSIRKLYEQVTSPYNDYDTQPSRMTDRFSQLRLLAKEECQPEFFIEVNESSHDSWLWDYRLKIGKQVIFQSEMLNKSSNNNFDEISDLAKCIECANDFISNNKKGNATQTLMSETFLMTDKPNIGFLLKYLNDFIKKTDILWFSANKNNQERLLDQNARRDFNRSILINQHLNTQSATDKIKMLENMEGKFGQRIRGIVEFAAEKVGQNEEDLMLISTTYKYNTLLEDLIMTLRHQSGMKEVAIGKPENIRHLGELAASEIQTLSMVGIKQEMLE